MTKDWLILIAYFLFSLLFCFGAAYVLLNLTC